MIKTISFYLSMAFLFVVIWTYGFYLPNTKLENCANILCLNNLGE